MRLMVLMLSGLWLGFAPSLLTAADTVPMVTTANIPNAILSADEEAQIPGQEAGVLTKIFVREGDQVTAGGQLAQIDDVIPRAQRDVAFYKLKVAEKQAADDIDKRFAAASAAVAEAEYLQAMEANAKVQGAVPQADVRRRLLEHRKMVLSIEKAEKDLAVAALQARVAQAELDAATANVERRRILAPNWLDRFGRPLDAVVVELSKHAGEWVQAGEPVMKLVRIDHLRVDGVLNATEYRPSEIQGRPVRVTVMLPRLGRETLVGKIVYVKPVIEGGTFQGGTFQVRAEVENRKRDGAWLLNPGMNAEMSIELK